MNSSRFTYYFQLFFCCVVFIFSTNTHTVNAKSLSQSYIQDRTTSKRTIELIAGLSKPPFIFEKENKGLQLDIIKAALETDRQRVHFIFMPLGRNFKAYKKLNIDGVITLSNEEENLDIFLSKPYISYQNVAVSLKENDFAINSISDLKNHSVVAFQNAHKFLGKLYQTATSQSSNYIELADQSQQLNMLFSRRVDVIILDVNIFKYLLQQNTGKMYAKSFDIHSIFMEKNYVAGFKDETIRNQFDTAIIKLKLDGEYQKLIDRYIK